MWDKNLKFPKKENLKSIAIVDSGFGGLFIMKELIKAFPYESFIYFGDNARCPYGKRGREEIIYYSLKIAEFLNTLNIKALILGCNTISAYAYDILKKRFSIDVFDVITPAVKKILNFNKNIEILATEATILSNVYQKNLVEKKDKVSFFSCPLFVSLVEEGIFDDNLLEKTVSYYLKKIKEKTVFLGCTHYLFFKEMLKKKSNKKIIDSVSEFIEEVKKKLKEKSSFLNIPKYIFYTTKDKKRFKKIAEKILQMEGINVREKKNIID